MNLLTYPNPMLTTPCQEFDFNNPPFDPHEVSQEMIRYCSERKYVSLAANQIGLPYRLFVILGSETFACFNPKVVMEEGEQVLLEESCPSFPGMTVKIKRASQVRLRFQTPSGGTDTKRFHGLSSKVILHEIDHLDGELFYNRASRYHRELAFNKRDKLIKHTRKEHEEHNRIKATGFSGVVI
jgi:peptide deformylase